MYHQSLVSVYVPLIILPKDKTSKLAGLLPTLFLLPLASCRKGGLLLFKVLLYGSTREINGRSTNCEVDALSTTPSHPLLPINNNSPITFLLLLVATCKKIVAKKGKRLKHNKRQSIRAANQLRLISFVSQ